MSRILLAVGHEAFEKYLKDSVKNHNFVGEVSYREAVISNCLQTNPDILIVRETLPGAINILDLIYDIRQKCFNTRIIFISKERKIGDPLLSELVSIGVFDILTTNPIKIADLTAVIEKPNSYGDVSFYRQKFVFDEKNNDGVFTAPKQIVKTIYVEKTLDGEKTVGEDEKELKDVNSANVNLEDKNNKKSFLKKSPKPTKEDVNVNKNELVEIEESYEKIDSTDLNTDVENLKGKDKMSEKKSGIFGTKKKPTVPVISKTKIISFIGSNHGVGSTQVSFNTAVGLAKNYKTLYIEAGSTDFNIHSILYLNSVGKVDIYRGDNMDEAIITKSLMIKNVIQKSEITKNYKLLPDKLNFLFLPMNDDIKTDILKDLLINLTLKYEYDFIIFDLGGNQLTEELKLFISKSSQVYMITTQDINYISSAEKLLKKLVDEGISNINIVINKFEKDSIVDNSKIEEFTEKKVVTNVPYLKDIINNNYLGIPSLLKSKDKVFQDSINNMMNLITNY